MLIAFRLLDSLQDLIEVEALRLLPRGIVLEAINEGRGNRLSPQHHVGLAERPIVVGVRGDIAALVRVHAQIVNLGESPAGERLSPDVERASSFLLTEDSFPISGPYRDELAIVVEVDEALPIGMVLLASQEWKLVIAVEMYLVGAWPDLPAFQQAIFDLSISGRG